MRYDLSFFLCCCKSFLGDDPQEEEEEGGGSFYDLLGLERDASPDDIKRAYKRQSLQMHPDKLAQRGQAVTAADQAKFTRMKEAYEVLSDPHKRETYDAIGERGMKWMEEPFSIDPQELAHNFANSSALDRSKIFSIFVAVAVAVLILPILVCLHVDGVFGPDAPWLATLVPLWLWDAFVLFYHVRVILMGPITRPDHIPPEEWVDPLPMKKRVFSLIRFKLICLFEILVALKLDHILNVPWFVIFFPLYIWEATTLYKKWPLARMRIVTVEDLETALGKPFSEFTQAEKELIGKRYSVVPSVNSPDFEAAQKLKTRARHDIIKSFFRIIFVAFLLVQLDSSEHSIDGSMAWNWWAIFSPFWIMTILICYANYQAFAEVQAAAMKKDPTLFGVAPAKKDDGDVETGDAGAGGAGTTTTGYGAVGTDGTATPAAAASTTPPQSELSEEEREELKATLMASSSRLCSKCCSQGFLLFVVVLFVAKLQGAGFSSLWIISPFLLVAGIILTCLGCAIFGITEVPTDGVEFDTADFGYMTASATAPSSGAKPAATPMPAPSTAGAASPPIVPPPPVSTNYAPPPPPPATRTSSNISSGGGGRSNPILPAVPEPPKESEATTANAPLTTGPTPVVPVMAAHPSGATAAATAGSATATTPAAVIASTPQTAAASTVPGASTAPKPTTTTTAPPPPIDLLDDAPPPPTIPETASAKSGGGDKATTTTSSSNELHDLD